MSVSISTALYGVVSMLQVGQAIYSKVTELMDAIEESKESGASKKEWVLVATKDFILSLGKDWDDWAKYVSDFIDAAKSIYNSLKGIF